MLTHAGILEHPAPAKEAAAFWKKRRQGKGKASFCEQKEAKKLYLL
jgi:hypothetical protein